MFLFNEALNRFCLRLYGVGHMVKVKDYSDGDRRNSKPPQGLLFPISTIPKMAFGTPVV